MRCLYEKFRWFTFHNAFSFTFIFYIYTIFCNYSDLKKKIVSPQSQVFLLRNSLTISRDWIFTRPLCKKAWPFKRHSNNTKAKAIFVWRDKAYALLRDCDDSLTRVRPFIRDTENIFVMTRASLYTIISYETKMILCVTRPRLNTILSYETEKILRF